MKKNWCFLALLVLIGMSVSAQKRSDILINIPPVKAPPDRAAFADYFQENFEEETKGAGYTLTDDKKMADYVLLLEVKPNMVMYDDGTMDLAPPDERQSVLSIVLVRSEDNAEIVAFSFPFDNVEEMNDFNLYLLYEAMANVPFTKLGDIPLTDDWWRNKWIYIRISVDYPITFYGLIPDSTYGAGLWKDPNPQQGDTPYRLDNIINPWLAATVGIEFQYLNWMSTELGFNLSFSDPMSNAFIATLQVEQKFPIKPNAAKNFMIEPYAIATFPTNTSPNSQTFPKLGVGGGLQLGTKGGSMGAFFVDVNFVYYLENVVTKNNNDPYLTPDTIKYYRYVVGLGIGYKIGIINRPEIRRRGGQ